MISASLIISVYNKPDYLKLVLAGLERQTFRNFEIIIADDGSNSAFTSEVEMLSRKSEYPLIHLWQEDNGFRKNKILNRAILASRSDYIIFIDGDCIPHKDFVREHFENRKDKVCLTGRRVNLSEKITGMLTTENIKNGFLENEKYKLFADGLFGNSTDIEKGFYFKNNFLRTYFNKKKRGLLGCNFSIYKKELLSVNGFDERYVYPSIGEDSDIQYRLELNGIKVSSLNNIAIQYHLYHKIQPRNEANLKLFEQVKASKLSFTPFGIQSGINEISAR